MDFSVITKNIEPHEIEWRIQRVSKGKEIKTTIVPYITNRCVMERFDEAFGWNNWESKFTETTTGYLCEIKVLVGERFVTKMDGATKTKIEPDKGGISDSMKRCAVQFGLGRCLYKYPLVQIKGEHNFIQNEIIERLNQMVKIINEGRFNKNYVLL